MPTTRMPCSNAAKTPNPLEFAGVPQTNETISAASGPKFTILWGHVEEILLLNKFLFRLSMHALFAKIQPDKVVRWCPDGDFWRLFCVPYLQRAPCRTFQTCILNSHQGHAMCRSMVEIQSVAAEIRRGKKKKIEEDRQIEITGQKYNGPPITQVGHNNHKVLFCTAYTLNAP